MQPFYQGKIDVFCAIYAVLNGLKVTHHIRTLQARDIFHNTLMGIAKNPHALKSILEQRTDYISLVDAMLHIQSMKFPLIIERPFEHTTAANAPDNNTVWESISNWLAPNSHKDMPSLKHVPERAIIFRFLRYLIPGADPVNRHWTTVYIMQDDELKFFDCSLEESAIYHVDINGFVTKPELISPDCLCCIEPHSMRFIAPRK